MRSRPDDEYMRLVALNSQLTEALAEVRAQMARLHPYTGKEYRIALRPDKRGELFGSARPWAKLTERAIVTIRERAARGDVQAHIARDYGVSPAAICEIVSRKKWPHVA